MHKLLRRLITLSLLAAAIAGLALPVAASDAPMKPEAAQTEKSGSKIMPFQGKISAVDSVAKTLTLAGKEKNRTLVITSETKITKQGKPAVFADAAVGEEVGGRAKMIGENRYEAVSLRIGPKPTEEGSAPTKKSKTE